VVYSSLLITYCKAIKRHLQYEITPATPHR